MITLYHATYKKFRDSILKNGLKVANKDGFLAYGTEFYRGPYIYLADNDELALSYIETAIDINDNKEAKDAYNSGFVVFKIQLPNSFELEFDANVAPTNEDLLEELDNAFESSDISETEKYYEVYEMPLHILLKVSKKLNIQGFTFRTSENIPSEYIKEI